MYGSNPNDEVLKPYDEMREALVNAKCSWCKKPIIRAGGAWFHPDTKSFTCISRTKNLNRDAKPEV